MTDVDYRAVYLKVRDELAELQQREWVGLTDDEMDDALNSCDTTDIYKYFRVIEAKLKEKNT